MSGPSFIVKVADQASAIQLRHRINLDDFKRVQPDSAKVSEAVNGNIDDIVDQFGNSLDDRLNGIFPESAIDDALDLAEVVRENRSSGLGFDRMPSAARFKPRLTPYDKGLRTKVLILRNAEVRVRCIPGSKPQATLVTQGKRILVHLETNHENIQSSIRNLIEALTKDETGTRINRDIVIDADTLPFETETERIRHYVNQYVENLNRKEGTNITVRII